MAAAISGVFIAWDEEEVDVERRGAGTVHDRTIVTGRWMVARRALWTNEVTDENIESAERYAEGLTGQYENPRVIVRRPQ